MDELAIKLPHLSEANGIALSPAGKRLWTTPMRDIKALRDGKVAAINAA